MTRKDAKEIASFFGAWFCVIVGAVVITHVTAGNPESPAPLSTQGQASMAKLKAIFDRIGHPKPYTLRLLDDDGACRNSHDYFSHDGDVCTAKAQIRCLTAMMADKDGALEDCDADKLP